MPAFPIRSESAADYYRHIDGAMEHEPRLTLDNGADLISWLHLKRTELLAGVAAQPMRRG